MTAEECWQRLATAHRATLSTLNPDGRIDAVPVVFAVGAGGRIVVPVDTVKAKSTVALQRIENLRRDPRATVLADHYDDDWSALWWVRFQGEATTMAGDRMADAVELLAQRYPQYRGPGSIVAVIELIPTVVTGWREG
ncbi:MAG: hypothetical protein QOG64_2869 [Acidimicrobiaceae bacterium]|nr:hypothetical protein [Acidimicrobiaceae bacterium]